MAAADDAFQRGDHFGSGHGYLDRFVVLQDGLHLVPGRPVDDPFVLAGVTAVLVGDLADIDPVVEQPVDMGGVPFGALTHLAFLGGPGLGAVTLFVQLLAQLLGRADLDEAAEDVLHRPGFIRVDHQFLVLPVDVVSEDGYAAAVFSPALGGRYLVTDTLGDDLPLVLGEGDQDAEKHPAGGVGGAEVLGDRDEADTLLVEEVNHLHEVQQRAGQPVDLVDDDHIDLPGVDVRQQAAQPRTLHVPARETTIVIAIRQSRPAPHPLSFDIVFRRFPLRIQRVELLFETFLVALAGVDGTAQGLVLSRRDIAVIKHLNLPRLFCRKPSSARKRPCRSSASR